MVTWRWLTILAFVAGAAHAAEPQLPNEKQLPTWTQSPLNGHWYGLTDPGTWSQVSDQASDWGGELAAVQDQAEQDWMAATFDVGHPKLYFGLYQDLADPGYSEPSGGWKWTSGEPLGLINWGTNEPNDWNFGEHVGEFSLLSNGWWNDIDGNIPQPGIAELISADCNGNNLPDIYEIAVGLVSDANLNGVPDSCDPQGQWLDLGNALAGSSGVPSLVGTGALFGNDAVSLDLANAKPFALSFLVLGLSNLSIPFKSGVLVPNPDFLLPITVDGFGVASLSTLWPVGVPSGATFYSQFWISDPAGPAGFAASNGLSGTTP